MDLHAQPECGRIEVFQQPVTQRNVSLENECNAAKIRTPSCWLERFACRQSAACKRNNPEIVRIRCSDSSGIVHLSLLFQLAPVFCVPGNFLPTSSAPQNWSSAHRTSHSPQIPAVAVLRQHRSNHPALADSLALSSVGMPPSLRRRQPPSPVFLPPPIHEASMSNKR